MGPIGVAAITLVFNGCQMPEEPMAQDPVGESGAFTSNLSGSGLQLHEETREALNLETAEVFEARFQDELHVSARAIGTTEDGRTLIRALVPPAWRPSRTDGISFQPLSGDAPSTKALLHSIDDSLLAVNGSIEAVFRLPKHPREGFTPDSGWIIIRRGQPRTSTAIPNQSLIRAALGDFVFVESGDSQQRRSVKVGQQDQEKTEILSGLKTGEKVITVGSDRLWILELALVGGMSNLENITEVQP